MLITSSESIGASIRSKRKLMGLTQLDAAGLCGVGERFLSELERGKATAELGKVLQVLNRLGLHLTLNSVAANVETQK